MLHENMHQLSREDLIEIIVSLSEQVTALKAELASKILPKKTAKDSLVPTSKREKLNRPPSRGGKRQEPKRGLEGRSRKRQSADLVVELKPLNVVNVIVI